MRWFIKISEPLVSASIAAALNKIVRSETEIHVRRQHIRTTAAEGLNHGANLDMGIKRMPFQAVLFGVTRIKLA